jgi:hypothetical protein
MMMIVLMILLIGYRIEHEVCMRIALYALLPED